MGVRLYMDRALTMQSIAVRALPALAMCAATRSQRLMVSNGCNCFDAVTSSATSSSFHAPPTVSEASLSALWAAAEDAWTGRLPTPRS